MFSSKPPKKSCPVTGSLFNLCSSWSLNILAKQFSWGYYHSSQVCIHHFSQTSWVHIVHIIYSSSFLVHRLYHNINCVYWYFPPDESHKVSVDSFHDWITDNSSFGSLIHNSNSKIVKGFYSHRILGINFGSHHEMIYIIS
jgi:hypothetical protein